MRATMRGRDSSNGCGTQGLPGERKTFLEAGAKRDLKDNRGETPLMHAIERNHTEVVELLKAAGGKE